MAHLFVYLFVEGQRWQGLYVVPSRLGFSLGFGGSAFGVQAL